MQTLVGPTALLPELRTSVTVLSTAIMLFRRFYLSNSILYFNPRKMAAACALFAAKSEEEKIEVSHHDRVGRSMSPFDILVAKFHFPLRNTLLLSASKFSGKFVFYL